MTSKEKERFLADTQYVIDLLGDEFDSHEFINKFIYNFPKAYGRLLEKHGNVATVHAEIANFLRIHSSILNIKKSIHGVVSSDIFSNDVQNAKWYKVKN